MTALTAERSVAGPVRRAWAPLATGAGVLLATVALRLRDPHVSGSWGGCPLRAFTGLDCPMCGGLRGVNDLTHGQVGAAAASNLLFVLSVPLLLAAWGWWTWRRATEAPALVSGRTTARLLTVYGVLALLFTVWRNTPWGHGLWA